MYGENSFTRSNVVEGFRYRGLVHCIGVEDHHILYTRHDGKPVWSGNSWDGGDVAFRPETWAAVWRVLKPGAFLLAFAGTRTYHRMASAIDDGGFEVRDAIAWLYGQGMPKSHNAKAPEWKGWGTALKPAMELIAVARKPLAGSVAFNLEWHGTGALNIDGCRIETTETWHASGDLTGGDAVRVFGNGLNNSGRSAGNAAGRWPANVIHDGSDETMAAFAAHGSGGGGKFAQSGKRALRDNPVYGVPNTTRNAPDSYGDSGTAARFYYCAKATAADRAGSGHPTVKPVALMRYLARLVTQPGGHTLDPFAGSGTTGAAALLEGFSATLIEREDEYADDIRHRFGWESLTGAFRRNVKARKRLASALQAGMSRFTTIEDRT
jgi:site-specific DNA-methyltransferase (adenine-specific)